MTSSTTSSQALINDSNRHSLTWSRVKTEAFTPPARSGAASVVVQKKLYMFGGYGGGTGRLDDFYSFSFETNTWEEVEVLSEAKPGCRENNGVVIGDSSRVYLFGGYNGNAWLNDLWMFDIETKEWTCIQESRESDEANALIRSNDTEDVYPSRRFGYVSVVHEGKFIVFGGFDGSSWLNDMYEFNFSTNKWKKIVCKGQLPSVRSCPAWAKDSHYVYIHGGYDGVERKSDFMRVDLGTYTWHEMPSRGTPPSPRYFHSCCLYEDQMYVYGGYSGNVRLADMYVYNFETTHWSQVDCNHGDCPSGRSSLVLQVYDNYMFIFGGYNGEKVLDDSFKFKFKAIAVPPPSLVNDLRGLLHDHALSDVTFLVEGQEIHANRAILAARSDYFRAMLFNAGMKESILAHKHAEVGSEPDTRLPIAINDVSYSVFCNVIEYIYTDSIRNITLDLAIQLLIISEEFMLDRLKGLCEDMIRKEITVNNVMSILLDSHSHRASGLYDIALEFVVRNLKNSSILNDLQKLKVEPDLLIEIIKRSSNVVEDATVTSPFGGSEW